MKFLIALMSLVAFQSLSANEWIKHINTHSNSCYVKLLKKPEAFRQAVMMFADHYRDYKLDALAGIDTGGLIFGTAVAYELKIPFVLLSRSRYNSDVFELDLESVEPGWIVALIDDVLKDGESAKSACNLLESSSCMVIEMACLVERTSHYGKDLMDRPVFSLISLP